jgi:ribosomal protein S18 acetylase RimI-like enzyme
VALRLRPPRPDELERVARMNVALQEDEGAYVMRIEHALARLRAWLDGPYRCTVFVDGEDLAGYALHRPTDPDSEGHPGGVYLRQLFIVRERRRRGLGREAFSLLVSEVFPEGCYITLEALVANPDGQAFWKALGFREYSVRFERAAALTPRRGR